MKAKKRVYKKAVSRASWRAVTKVAWKEGEMAVVWAVDLDLMWVDVWAVESVGL